MFSLFQTKTRCRMKPDSALRGKLSFLLLFHLTQFCAKQGYCAFPLSYSHTDTQRALALPPSKIKQFCFFKNELKYILARFFLSFHINVIFPCFSGSAENKAEEAGVQPLPSPPQKPPAASPPLGAEREDGEAGSPGEGTLGRAWRPVPTTFLPPLLPS